MAARKRGGTRRQSIDAASPNTTTVRRSASNDTPEQAERAFDFGCPLCGRPKGRANLSTRTGEWVVSCWSLSCGERSYLFDLARALGVRGGGYALKESPHKYLKPYIIREVAHAREPEPLPSEDDILAWQRMLLEDDVAMDYLRHERGLTMEVIGKAMLGYDGRAFTIPIKEVRTRELVNLRRRFWPNLPASGAKYMGLAGRTLANGGVTVYPGLPARGSLILLASEFDALVLWSHKLPGITVTSGAATRWRQEWSPMVKGRRIAVMYDADPHEEEQAVSRAAELRRAGAQAWVVKLSETGLRDGEDVTDWFVKHRRSRQQLLDLITRQRPAGRRARGSADA